MSTFNRCLKHLDEINGDVPTWWRDLLSLWMPSGQTAGDFGLRLAIRDNYLNFYRCGQSVARVEILAGPKLRATIHHKYILRLHDKLDEATLATQAYLQLEGDSIRHKGLEIGRYQGLADLRKWISTIDGGSDRGYSGDEKRWVDKIVAVNPDIIDVEMGLPACGEVTVANRIDIVALERDHDGIKIVFWEAKLSRDGRMRTRGEVKPGKVPKVLEQLDNYNKFISANDNEKQVVSAYKRAAEVLSKLAVMANDCSSRPLGELIKAIKSGESFSVDKQARLVILDEYGTQKCNAAGEFQSNEKRTALSKTAWAMHVAKLRQVNVPMQIFVDGDSPEYRLVKPR
jgi:hypothetical protein